MRAIDRDPALTGIGTSPERGRSLMLVTALSPVIGYDKASSIAHDADRSGRTLRETALDCGASGAEDGERIVNPANMVGPF